MNLATVKHTLESPATLSWLLGVAAAIACALVGLGAWQLERTEAGSVQAVETVHERIDRVEDRNGRALEKIDRTVERIDAKLDGILEHWILLKH
ncbi:MAG: hypothetical protein KY476_00705 [Planctomycetes bacterium]|nr:hypothetical protein [Planctomycetota bacterium]